LLASTALVNACVAGLALAGTLSLVAIVASSSVARADGGKGGDSEPGTGGAGGVGSSGAPGGAGSPNVATSGFTGGGGGGGAGGGGNGGNPGGTLSIGAGGAGGTLASPNGAPGSASGSGGGGGGGFNGAVGGNGGSGGAAGIVVGAGLSISGFAGGGGGGGGSGLGTGGAGGAGGVGGETHSTISSPTAGDTVSVTGSAGQGGGGGDGGVGNLQAGSSLTVNANSLGGAGGVGGAGGAGEADATDTAANATASATAIGGNGGNGGAGGTGLQSTGSGSFTFNAAITGANGGSGGVGGSAASTATANGTTGTFFSFATGGTGGNGGNGGVGLNASGSNITVTIAGNLSAGNGGNGGAGGDSSITFSGAVFDVKSLGGQGGIGGTGGAGALFAGSSVSVSNLHSLSGGNGGSGGAAGVGDPTFGQGTRGGDGGTGGTGVSFAGANATFTNANAGQVAGGVGGNGGASSLFGGTGGVGGTAMVFAGSGATLVNAGTIAGGAGGNGGQGLGFFSFPQNGSFGGNGGTGVVFGGSGTTLVNSGHITGGNGGNAFASSAANGGEGGVAVTFLGSNARIINTGTITGGNNGNPGSSFSGVTLITGAAISGSGLTINNDGGTIRGGTDSTGTTRAAAISLLGGANAISTGGIIDGGVFLSGAGASLSVGLPGSTAGQTLNISGLLVFNPSTTYNVRVNGAANDSITTNSFAEIQLATVSATVTGNALGKHAIITAGSGVVGTFTSLSVSGNSAFLQESLSYDPTHVFLDVIGNGANGGIDFTSVAQTTNQANVASALNAAGNANGFSGPLINFIAGLSAAQARAAFTVLDGEAGTGAQRAAFRFGDQFLNMMLDPFIDGHFDNPAGGGATGFAPEQQADLSPEIASAYASVFKAAPASFEQRWSIWNAAFGGSGKTSGNAVVGSSDTTLSTYGFAGGIDYRFSPYTTVGLAAAGGGTNWGLAGGLGNGRSDSAQVGAYARTRIGAAYISESVAVASHWFSTNRTALGDTLRATFTGESFGGRIEGGYRLAVMSNFGITPYAAAQAQAFRSGAYSETDVNNLGFGLSYAAKETTDVRTELGARFDNPTLLNGTPLIVHARLAWAHDTVNTPSLSAAFQTLPLSNFTVLGAPIPQNSGLASIGADWFINPDWKLLAKFDGEFASRSNLYAGSVALRHSW
jgi:uncharacterized protein with beta-barrel porin domain